MKETLERELKLAVDDGFELPPLPIAITPRRLRAIYYDTTDHRLARRGVTLRRRSEDGHDHWQLKLPADGDRLELEWEADDSAIPAELAALVTAFVRGRPLEPVAELHTLRRSVKVTSGGRPAAEVVHDTVEVLQGSRVVRSFAEVEIEQLADGASGLMTRLERQLRAVGARRGDGRPKLFQALDLPVPRRVAPKRRAPAIEHLRAYLLRQVDSLLQNDPVTRRGEMSGVHAMRVATRRMRSALKEARRLLEPGWVRETRAELEWLGGMLGEVRDPDVFASYVAGQVERLAADAARGGAELARLIAERTLPARARLAEALDSPRYLALLDRLDGIAESLPAGPGDETIERMLRRAARRVRRKLRRTPASATDEALHELRIAAKRARYAGELAESRAGRPARRLSARAERVQEILGEHQDAVVATSELTSLVAAATPPAAFTAGILAERQRGRRKAARSALPKAAKRLERSARRI